MPTISSSSTLTNKTLTSPVINGATGTGGKFTGDLTGLAPSVPIHIAVALTHDGGDGQATFHDTDSALVASQLIGMTIYNTTDGSSCTITANDDHTITCTLAGGTQKDRKSTRLNSSHRSLSRMPSSA